MTLITSLKSSDCAGLVIHRQPLKRICILRSEIPVAWNEDRAPCSLNAQCIQLCTGLQVDNILSRSYLDDDLSAGSRCCVSGVPVGHRYRKVAFTFKGGRQAAALYLKCFTSPSSSAWKALEPSSATVSMHSKYSSGCSDTVFIKGQLSSKACLVLLVVVDAVSAARDEDVKGLIEQMPSKARSAAARPAASSWGL